ncbi:MAG: aminodeoxychorismate/anthranilate synthase component II [Bacteroidota bacterium]|nr:aminodeoxychorismate/anthranilate synthase component II [Bacteroidota bacterium]
MILVIDNYDSFTYNLVHLLGRHTSHLTVVRNDAVSCDWVDRQQFAGIIISPGPGRPASAGICKEVIIRLGPHTPILGVCLGHQAIGEVFGATVTYAPSLMHGKTSIVHHTGAGLFDGIPESFSATRYHSLVVDPATITEDLEVTASTADGVVMGLRHRRFPIEGVQFHPESVLTSHGPRLVANWLNSTELTL